MTMLPMKNGVCASTLYLPKLDTPAPSLLTFLCEKFPHISPKIWQARFLNQEILDENTNPLPIDSAYRHGTRIFYYRFVDNEVVVPFAHDIIFENDNIIVADKPHFLTTAPAGNYVTQTLLSRLKQQTNNPHLTPIHRLDKDTAGLIMFSKTPATRHLYQELFKNQRIHKIYHAIAKTRSDLQFPYEVNVHLERGTPFYVMQVSPNKPANSSTRIEVLQSYHNWAKYELIPTTGKLHQLRAHLNHLDIPIKNDPYYPTVCHVASDDFSQPLQLLAKSLYFYDPISQQALEFHSSRTLVL